MDNAKHTPGPWIVRTDPADSVHTIEDSKGYYIGDIAAARGYMQLGAADGQEWIDRYEANARLIAASPDLLDALVVARGELRAFDHIDGVCDALDIADAAIAKVTAKDAV